MRRKNVAKAWFDYKKAYGMVMQSWIIDCRKLYKLSDEVIKFYRENHEKLESGIEKA